MQTRTKKWNLENIKKGIDRFYTEQGRFPTATDFDYCDYLPSARQVQRVFGGFETLRTTLGYEAINYTKGPLRTALATIGWQTGLNAEELLEEKLIDMFGELFVHVQKRTYKKLKNRFDFFVYCNNARFGIDIFTTGRAKYIDNNVRHKIRKYKDVPADIPVYFVVDNDTLTAADIALSISGISDLRTMPNIQVITLSDFLKHIKIYEALLVPEGFKSVF